MLSTNVNTVLQEELSVLVEAIKADVPVVSGRTRDSITLDVSNGVGTIFGRAAFATVETGRKPGKVPRGFYKIILEWAERKGIQVDNIKTFSYFVAKKIAESGSYLHRNGRLDNIYSDKIPTATAKIGERLAGIFEQEITSI